LNLGDIWAAVVHSGPIAVLLLFLDPVGPGVVAGILVARSQGLSPTATIGIYAVSDAIAAVPLETFIQWLHHRAVRSPIGEKLISGFGELDPISEVVGHRIGRPASLISLSFIINIIVARIVSIGYGIPILVAWTLIILGDVLYFTILYLASASLAAFLTDNRVVFVFTLVLGFGLPILIRRLVRRRQDRPEGPRVYPVDPRFPPTGVTNPDRPRSRQVSPEADHDGTS
jgi:hypothetical protein